MARRNKVEVSRAHAQTAKKYYKFKTTIFFVCFTMNLGLLFAEELDLNNCAPKDVGLTLKSCILSSR